ncbi:MAG: 4-hydroxy-tetrahydrodipicolinate synthase [Candidatus Kapabacteria bacterium]|nr:4-hydroxy-tetrahydrodipicolinate synthase [Candidatus Kapabacteria bacterium]
MSNNKLTGLITAVVTPFTDEKEIDFLAFKKILDYQLEGAVDGIVVCGSTGEGATLSNKEKVALFTETVDYINGRCAVIAGTGSNNTQQTIDLTLIAKEHGCDGVLLVAPYYNKPSQEGIYHHFRAIADAVDVPQIIYNVPGRTGININAETQIRLAQDCPNIVATKEASANLEQMMQIMKYAPEGFNLLSGDDALALPVIAMGGKGVISVLSNIVPKQFGDCIHAAMAGDYELARSLHYDLFDLMQINFIESNPIPIKTALSLAGLCSNNFRLPLIPLKIENKEKLINILNNLGFNVINQ